MRFRYLIVFATFLLTILLYIDRICISVAKAGISEDLDLSDAQMGWILSAFALGYASFQVPSGMLADNKGPRIILTTIVALWSGFTALTGAAWNFVSLLVIRALFGAGEAGAFPAISRVTFSWIPMNERGVVTGINFSGSRLGAAFALPFVAWLIEYSGWRISFFVLGLVGIVWALIWYLFFRDNPEEHSSISSKELDHILLNRQSSTAKTEMIGLGRIVRSGNMMLVMFQYFCSNFTFFFCLTWLFPHIQEQYGLSTMNAGLFASIPLLFGAFGNWFSGWLVDKIYANGKWKMSRRIPAMIGFALASVGLIGSLQMNEVEGAVFFLSIAVFGADMTLSPSWALCVDIGKENSGGVSGSMNMAGNIGSFLTALAFPYLREWTGSVEPFFFLGAFLNVLALIAWRYIDSEKQITIGTD